MTITQLSNLFNLIVQNDAAYNYYHYGWPSDMNLNIQNNSDPNAETGRLFPYVLFMPPTVQSRAMDNNVNSIFDTYTCELLITDTYAYNQGLLTYKNDTTVEIEHKLQVLAKKFIQYLLDYSDVALFNVSDYNVEFDPYRFTNDTRSIRIRLTLVFPAICDDESLDISFLPEDYSNIDQYDYEKVPVLSYCPIGLEADTEISTEYNKSISWVVNANAFALIAEIESHPDYAGGVTIKEYKVTDALGAIVGGQTISGTILNVVGIDTVNPEVYFTLVVSALFDAGAGPHEILHTLNVTIPQPIENDPPVNYDSNSYACEDTEIPT